MANILIVEDEAIIARDLQWRLQNMGYDVPLILSSGEDAVSMTDEVIPDLILMDIMLSGRIDGIEAAGQIRSKSDVPIIYLTSFLDENKLQRAITTEPFGYLIKPVKDNELKNAIELTIYRHKMDRELRESERRYNYLYDNLGDAAFIIGLNDRFLDVNEVAIERLGYGKEELLQMTPHKINTPEYAAGIKDRMEQAIKSGHHFFETVHVTKDGKEIPVEIRVRLVQFKGEAALLALARDITERKRAEEELQKKIRLNKILMDNMPCVVLLLRPGTREIVASNKAAEKVGAIPGMQCFSTWGQRDETCPWCKAPELWTTGKAQHTVIDAEGIIWDAHWVPVSDDLYMHFAFDITERKNLEKTVLETEERERQLIGSDLHDGLGQMLTGISLKMQYLISNLKDILSPEVDNAKRIKELIEQAKEQTIILIKGLMPVDKDREGITSALAELTSNTGKMFNIPCAFTCSENIAIHNNKAVPHLYRIAQEALTNAAKHGKPRKIEIGLSRNNNEVELTVRDDGTGIPENPEQKPKGIGMQTINYRAGLIDASLEIISGADKGTEVKCTFTDKDTEESPDWNIWK